MSDFHIHGTLSTTTTEFLDGHRHGGMRDVAMLKLTQSGGLLLEVRTSTGSDMVPMEEWHGCTLTWMIMSGPGVLDVAALRQDLEGPGELHGLMRRVAAGHEVIWDGNNHIGILDEDAAQARRELDHHFETVSYSTGREVWDAGEWLQDSEIEGLTSTSTDEQLDSLVESLERWAESEGVILLDMESALRQRREELADDDFCE
jgi:hypothetical protein